MEQPRQQRMEQQQLQCMEQPLHGLPHRDSLQSNLPLHPTIKEIKPHINQRWPKMEIL